MALSALQLELVREESSRERPATMVLNERWEMYGLSAPERASVGKEARPESMKREQNKMKQEKTIHL